MTYIPPLFFVTENQATTTTHTSEFPFLNPPTFSFSIEEYYHKIAPIFGFHPQPHVLSLLSVISPLLTTNPSDKSIH